MFSTTLRSARHCTGAIALLSLAACADGSTTGPTDASLRRGGDAGDTSGGGMTSTAGRVEITLSRPAGAPFATAKGKAKYSNRGGERELQIEAENIPAGTAVSFVLDDNVIGSGTASALREVRLELNSDRGATVPTTIAGKSVSVRTAAGATIVAGSF